jgi:hypothetical protein
MLLNVETGVCFDVGEEADGMFVPSSGVLVQPHLHAITRFAWDMVSSETLDDGVVRNALLEKSITRMWIRFAVEVAGDMGGVS